MLIFQNQEGVTAVSHSRVWLVGGRSHGLSQSLVSTQKHQHRHRESAAWDRTGRGGDAAKG